MAAPKSSFLDRVLERIRRLDREGLQTVVQRLARERTFLETLFNTIEDGVLVADETGRILYVNQAVTRLLGLDPATAEGESVQHVLPELDWPKLAQFDKAGGKCVSRHEFDISYPRPRLIHLYAAPLDGEAVGSSGVALILHDATEARQRTQEAIESQRVQALTLLAASVAHEIGNPLNALDIHLQLLEREVQRLREPATGEDREPVTAGSSKRPKAARSASEARAIAERLDQYLGVCKGEVARLDYIIRDFLQALRPAAPKLQPANLND